MERFCKRERMLASGNLSVHIFKHVTSDRTYYDTVIYRKIRVGSGNGKKRYEYRRGANLKPDDLLTLSDLLQEAHTFIELNSTQ